MAAYTATTTGNWNSTATWSGAGIPGSGDTGTINSGVTVTVPDGYTATIGTTGGSTGTTALTVNSGGKLVIGQGTSGALRLQGDLSLSGPSTPLSLSAGAELRFVPASSQRIKVNHASGSGCVTVVGGTAAARCSVLTDPTALAGGGLTGYFGMAVNGWPQGVQTATCCDFTDLDDGAAKGGVQFYDAGSGNYTFTGNTFTRCGQVYLNHNSNAAGTCVYSDNIHSSSRTGQTYCVVFYFNNSPTGGATRTISGSSFDLSVNAPTGFVGCTVQYNVFSGGINQTDSAWLSFDSNVWCSATSAGQLLVAGPMTNCYLAKTPATISNPHFLVPSTARSAPISGCIFENWGSSDGQGDCLITSSQSTGPITGTVALSFGGAAVVGTGTSFTTGNDLGGGSLAGCWLVFSNDLTGTPYQVASVTDNTHLTLAAAYHGSTTGAVNAGARVVINGIAMSSGSQAVTGTGTHFTTQLQDATSSTPSWVVFSADSPPVPYLVQTINSDTSLTLATPYAGSGSSGYCYPVINTVMTGNLILGDAGNTNSAAGVLYTHQGLPYTYVTARHNTVAVGSQPGSSVAEAHNGFAGCLADVRANLFWSYSGAAIAEGKLWCPGSASSNRTVKQPVMSACATAATGGALAGGATYAYRVSALSACQQETLPAAEQTIAVPAGTNTNTVTVNWSANANDGTHEATVNYRIYGRASGAEQLLATIPGPGSGTLSWVDDGSLSPAGAMPTSDGSGTVQDKAAPALIDYCGGWNLQATYPANSWYLNQASGDWDSFSATPGVHDVTANPQFVAGNRGMATYWTAGLGNTTTGSSAGDAQQACNYIAVAPTMRMPAFLAWCRAGFRPADSAYQAASYPGDPSIADAAGNSWTGGAPGIGAMAVQPTTGETGFLWQAMSAMRPTSLRTIDLYRYLD